MMHWSGLRQAFGFHGDVVDSFVANKRDRNGRRFGFVRFSNRWDATRAIERLNGFNLYGSRISVSFAKYESRSSYWRKVKPSGYRNQGYNFEQGKPSGNKGGEISKKQVESNNPENDEQRRENASTELKSLDMSNMVNEGKRKKIAGHVENEDLWKYRRCLVGKMASVCSLSNVMSRLDTWGFGEITVKRMGGLSDNSSSVLRVSPKENGEETQKSLNGVTSSDSSSVSSRKRSPEKGSENINSLGDDSLIALSLGKEEIKGGCTTGMEPNRHLGENEMKGGEHGLQAKNINDKILSAERTVIEQKECAADVVEKEVRWADVAKKRLNDEDDEVDRGVEVELGENIWPVSGLQDNVSVRALDDLRYMGFQLRKSNSEYIEPSNNNGKSSWELAVDKLNEKVDNRGLPQNRQSFVKVVTLEEGVEARAFFPELAKKKLKEKRYCSLSDFQDKALSVLERKKKERAIRKERKKAKSQEVSELSGRSLSDSDLMARWESATKEARNAMELGKKVGIQFVGDERQMVMYSWDVSKLGDGDFQHYHSVVDGVTD
ncbi:hypothetical protein GQ457_09G013100 [Hibiscus cannabinus]